MRLIDAETEIGKIRKRICGRCMGFHADSGCGVCSIKKIISGIDNAPAIEAKPVVHAHWDEVSGGRIICTNCGNYPLYDYFGRLKLSDICPCCGATMDEPFSQAHENGNNTQKASVDGVKIPVISMEDVPKIMEEMEK